MRDWYSAKIQFSMTDGSYKHQGLRDCFLSSSAAAERDSVLSTRSGRRQHESTILCKITACITFKTRNLFLTDGDLLLGLVKLLFEAFLLLLGERNVCRANLGAL